MGMALSIRLGKLNFLAMLRVSSSNLNPKTFSSLD